MGPKAPRRHQGIVYSTAKGSNVIDVDGNRYVDLAAGFGALLLGHAHPTVRRVLELQSDRVMQALGDVYPSEAKIALCERLAKIHPDKDGMVILGQSGADAISAALKTALLATGRPGVVAFEGSYHGLSYGPLAASGLRESYRAPFSAQLNPHVRFVPYPQGDGDLALEALRLALAQGDVGALLCEPILGRGGAVVPPPDFLAEAARMTARAGALFIADEIWTGLGRSGHWLRSEHEGVRPDIFCLGKGLGGGLPVSACVGRRDLMQVWSREAEVVHTSTFAGAPLACTTALATLDSIGRDNLVARASEVGDPWRADLASMTSRQGSVREVRGAGLMIGIDLGDRAGRASELARLLLDRGYITSTGGGAREVLILTPPLNIAESLLDGFVAQLKDALGELGP
jgi:4-aminobutyrate aminotransferase/(S)-3-amino-2-methylpropionate transaminase